MYSSYMRSLLTKEHYEIVEVLNYSNLIVKFHPTDFNKLVELLKKDHCNHLYNIKFITNNNMFYIENCDLQVVTDLDLREPGMCLCNIEFTDKGFILKEE